MYGIQDITWIQIYTRPHITGYKPICYHVAINRTYNEIAAKKAIKKPCFFSRE